MNVVALQGSPRRRGNSSGLCQMLTAKLREAGHEILSYHLNDLTYRGCQACEGCKKRSNYCVLLDDLTPVLNDVANADIILLASPVYWGDVSAQLKAFIDRTYSFLTPDFINGPVRHRLESGKHLVFILSQGADEAMYDDIYPRYSGFYKELDLFSSIYLLRGCELSDRQDYASRPDLHEKVEKLAEILLHPSS